jgi:ribose transport system ATP-binding protein
VTLRDGAVVGSAPAASFTHTKLVSLMVGREINQLFPTRSAAPGNPLLEIKLKNVSLTVRSGEVVGLAGLMGAGRTELARSVFGVDRRDAGEILVEGEPLPPREPREAIARRMAFVTENRSTEGLCLNASVAENLFLVALPNQSAPPFRRLRFTALDAAVRRMRGIVKLDPKVSNLQPVRTLSGGNQQKVVLGKWLLNDPKALLLDEPTRGIDVGAKFEIYQLINQLAESGSAILFISSEIEELIGMCDRILVMRRGQIVQEFSRAEFDREKILNAALAGSGAT